MGYRAVLLDVGGTLVAPRRSFGEVYARALAGLGLDATAADYQRALNETLAEMDARVPSGHDRYRHFPGGEAEYWLRFSIAAIRRATGRELDERAARRFVEKLRGAFDEREAWHVFDDVVPVLSRLAERDVKLAVVSNWDSKLPRALEMLGLARYFDYLAVSHLENVEKPDPRLFSIALERLGCAASEAIHVGDRPELDVAGARAAGVEPALIARGSRRPEPGVWTDLTPLLDLT